MPLPRMDGWLLVPRVSFPVAPHAYFLRDPLPVGNLLRLGGLIKLLATLGGTWNTLAVIA